MFTNKVFDREGEDGKQVSVTIKAVDSGEPSLEGVCSFTVEILDTNDNPPLFDRQVFQNFQKFFFQKWQKLKFPVLKIAKFQFFQF